jgi:hypothetical protein
VRYRLLFLHLFVSAIIIFCYSYLGLNHGFFWTYWWWDALMHLLGGVWAAFLLAWMQTLRQERFSLWHYVGFALFIGGAWELLEYVGHFPRSPYMSYPLDTLKDLCVDAIGGAVTYYLIRTFRV